MFPPSVHEEFGPFRLVDESEYNEILQLVEPLLPRSRKIRDSILLAVKGLDSASPIYVPKDDPFSGIVVSLFSEYKDPATAITFTSQEKDAEKACEMVVSAVDWSKEIIFGAVSDWHMPFLEEICAKKSEIKYSLDCPLFEFCNSNLPRNILTLSDGLSVEPLDPKFGELVNSHWKFQDEFSLKWIQDQCQAGLGFGVFLQGREDPVSWMMAYKYGSMGLLYTRSEFRGLGYARLCVTALSNKMSELGIIPNVYIEENNVISIAMFERMGFEKKTSATWIVVSPKDHVSESTNKKCCV